MLAVRPPANPRRRGSAFRSAAAALLSMLAASPASGAGSGSPPGEDPAAAFAAAARDGRPVLLDFFGVWCPPCNRLAAEVIDDPEDAALIGRFHLVRLDADRTESWPWKTKYAVKGYPTVVVAAPGGELLARQEGYEGPEITVAWLRGALEDLRPLGALVAAAGVPGSAEPGLAAEVGWRLVDAGRVPEARPWVDRAVVGGAADAGRLAAAAALGEKDPTARAEGLAGAIEVAPDAADAPAWLRARISALESAGAAGALAAARTALVEGVDRRLKAVSALDRPTLLYFRAEAARGLGRAEEAGRDFRASAEACRAAIDAARGPAGRPGEGAKGWYVDYADALEQAGAPAEAEAALREAAATWGAEFTFHNALAGLLERLGRNAEARAEADVALHHSYGDNRLRAVDLVARLQAAAGDRAGAVALIERTLAGVTLPDDPGIRTHRYVQRLRDRLAGLAAPAP